MNGSTSWASRVTPIDRDKKNVARIIAFIDRLEADRDANPALLNDPAHWDKAERAIRALSWINARPMYSDEEALRREEVAAFDQQVHDLIHKAQRNLFTGSSAEAEMKDLQRSTSIDWDLAGIPDEFDTWLEQDLEVSEQRHLEERRRRRVNPARQVR